MKLSIEKSFLIEHVIPKFGEESYVAKQVEKGSRFGSTDIDIDVTFLTMDDIELLYDIAKDIQHKSLMSQITAFRSLAKNPDTAKIPSLKALVPGLIKYFTSNVIDGWIYHIDEEKIPHPYLIQGITFHEATSRDDRTYVAVEIAANSAKKSRSSGYSGRGRSENYHSQYITFDMDDIYKTTIPEMLAKRGYYHETPELKETYESHLKLFMEYQPKYNAQFLIEGTAYTSFDHSRDRFETAQAKAVNDEGILSRKFVEKANAAFWRSRGVEENFEDLPFHCYVYMFHLDLHENVWVHASRMKPYEYDKSLRDKLVLPQDHRDLIDILVEDMDVLQEDIIKGKSGGTTILCVGEPGLGKTLSAEVYSEVTERPLYRVHSGQLGLRANDVEKNLEEILKRAARWGAVLLIDEADVYIRTRGNDIQHNAVVASFLRTLEYFNGLLFMTTNRSNDVDDAILSRCIAVVKYKTPTQDNARRIWRVLSNSFQVELSDGLIEDLIKKFPNASGRDIKELLKLSSRYAKGKGTALDLETFRKCAQFRGLEAQQ